MPPAAPTTSRRARRPQAPALRFDQRLVLNQWILGLFEADSFIPLTDGLHDTALEGVDENNVSRFHHVIAARLFPRQQLNKDLLLAYDQNIVRHTQTISARRGDPPIALKARDIRERFVDDKTGRKIQTPDA